MPHRIPSYSKVYALGHAAVLDILNKPVVIQEKLDGSQFSFMLDMDGRLWMRSRGANINPQQPPKLFDKAVDTVRSRQDMLLPGAVYRSEAVCTKKHNTLAYGRIPEGGLALFDIDINGLQNYVEIETLHNEAARIGLECVPTFKQAKISSLDEVVELMDRESFLGGPKVEGIVFKSRELFTFDGKAMMAKHVSEEFKEKHRGNPEYKITGRTELLLEISNHLTTEARWQKAVQHLAEQDKLLGEPKDIGSIVAEVQRDVLEEEGDWIKEKLMQWAWRTIRKRVAYGLPEWYKNKLAANHFAVTEDKE